MKKLLLGFILGNALVIWLTRKFAKFVCKEANLDEIFRYIWLDIIVPALKNLITNTVTTGANRVVYGEAAGPTRNRPTSYAPYNRSDPRGRRGPTPHVPYTTAFPKTTAQTETTEPTTYILASRENAHEVVQQLASVIDRYEVVTENDLHELLGLPQTIKGNERGWNDVSHFEIRQTREGWVLEPDAPISIPKEA